MEIRPAGFTPGQRRDNPRVQERAARPEVLRPTTSRAGAEPQPRRAEVEPFKLKADRGYREANILLGWLKKYAQDFDRIQQTGKVYEWVQGSGEKYPVVNEELAEMVEEKMDSLGLDDPKMAATVLHQEMYTRGFEQVQKLRRTPGLSADDRDELDTMYWDFDDRRPDQRRIA